MQNSCPKKENKKMNKSTKGVGKVEWTIVEVRKLGGEWVKRPFYDYSHSFPSRAAAWKELKEYGMGDDFEIRILPPKKTKKKH